MTTVQRKNNNDENHHDMYYVCVHFQQFAHQMLVGCPKTEYINNKKRGLVSGYPAIGISWITGSLGILHFSVEGFLFNGVTFAAHFLKN